jgi:activator of HSP90 ATPase
LGDQSIDDNHGTNSFKNDDNAYISSSTRSSEKNLKSPPMKAVTNNSDMIPKQCFKCPAKGLSGELLDKLSQLSHLGLVWELHFPKGFLFFQGKMN